MRSTGLTTEQLRHLPLNAYYVWIHSNIGYPKRLVQHLNRPDITIVAPDWLTGDRWRGLRFSYVGIDHAARLTDEQWDGWVQLQPYVGFW